MILSDIQARAPTSLSSSLNQSPDRRDVSISKHSILRYPGDISLLTQTQNNRGVDKRCINVNDIEINDNLNTFHFKVL